MKIIVGLGNPGAQYSQTRHNVGFLLLDQIYGPEFSPWKSKFQGLICEGRWMGEKCILVKPQTFMNLSGQCIRKVLDFYKCDPLQDLLVIYDDVDMEFGKLRYREKWSAGGHNGIKSLIQHLGGNQEFPRLKVGVGRHPHMATSDWVLSRFTQEEFDYIEWDLLMDVEKKLQ